MKVRNLRYNPEAKKDPSKKLGSNDIEFFEMDREKGLNLLVREFNWNRRTIAIDGYDLDIDKETGKATGVKKLRDDKKET